MCTDNPHDPREIKRHWEGLLGKKSREAEWQSFFETFPCALAQSLPLAPVPLTFKPLAHPGEREADFYFYEERPSPLPVYGMLDFKTASTRLISTARRGFPVISTSVLTGAQQLKYYAQTNLPELIAVPRKSLVLGAGAQLFVIAGLEEAVLQQLGHEIFSNIGEMLPRGVQLLPFDTLLRQFETANPRTLILVPAILAPGEAVDFVPTRSYRDPSRTAMVMLRAPLLDTPDTHEALRFLDGQRVRFAEAVKTLTQLLSEPTACYEVTSESGFKTYVYTSGIARVRTRGRSSLLLLDVGSSWVESSVIRITPFEDPSAESLGEATVEWVRVSGDPPSPVEARLGGKVRRLWG